VLVTGLTGAHKTTALILPCLLDAAGAGVSVVAFDLKYGERDSLAGAAAAWWRRGRTVLIFAPLDGASLRWNPLASCRSMGDAYEFAWNLFPDEVNGNADIGYWTAAERHVCAVLVWALVTDGEGRSVARLRAVAEAGPEAVAVHLHRHPRAPELITHLGAYRAMLPKDQAGILQGIAARLDAWSDERVSLATGGPRGVGLWDEIVLERLRREPTLLLVGVPQTALARLRTLCQLLMRTLVARLLQPRGNGESVPILYMLEELPAWGPLPNLADHLATFRSRDVAIVATIQSEAQGESVYGATGWAAIAANFVTKIYFPSLADPDAERLSRALGTATAAISSRSRGWSSAGRQDSEQTRVVEVPLRRPENLQGIGAADDEIIVRCPGLPPGRVSCPPFHVRPRYARLVPELPPSTIEISLRHYARCWSGDVLGRTVQTTAPAQAASVPAGLTVAYTSTATATSPAPLATRPALILSEDHDNGADVNLSAFIKDVLNHGPGEITPRVVCRGDRPVEVRLQTAAVFRLLGGGENAQAIVRRWAARRWVKQVRPVFVLERAALDTLDVDLRRRLIALGKLPRIQSAERPK
jgi:type IV secretory pathway TraG/TraD family ATPase VirD4